MGTKLWLSTLVVKISFARVGTVVFLGISLFLEGRIKASDRILFEEVAVILHPGHFGHPARSGSRGVDNRAGVYDLTRCERHALHMVAGAFHRHTAIREPEPRE